MIVIDSSVWVSWLVSQDVHHQTSRQWMAGTIASGEMLVVPSLALAEIAGAIARRTGQSADGRQSVRHLLRLSVLRVEPVDRALAMASALVAADLKLRGPDAIFATLAYRLAVPLITWDNELALRASRLISTLPPGG